MAGDIALSILELSEVAPWPWRLPVAVGLPLSALVFAYRYVLIGLWTLEGHLSAARRLRGSIPGSLAHGISDGLGVGLRITTRLALVPLLLTAAAAVIIFAGVESDAEWALDAQYAITDFAERVRIGGRT